MPSSLTIPAADLGDADDQTAAAALWAWTNGNIRLSGPTMWTRPRFDGATATRRRAVNRNPLVSGERVRWSSVPEWPARIPWRTDWKPGAGSDNACIITDPEQGVVWECQNLRYERPWDPTFSPIVCDNLHRRTPACIENETHMSRGCGGVPSEAGLLTASQAENGVTTALAMFTVPIQYGPGARIVPPAGRLEHRLETDRPGLPSGDVPSMIPAGTRFRVDLTDDEVTELAWRNCPDPGGPRANAAAALRRLALMNIYTGLRDFGAAVLATAGHTVQTTSGPQTVGTTYIETEGCQETTARNRWAGIGFRTDNDFRLALAGVFRPDNVKVVRPS